MRLYICKLSSVERMKGVQILLTDLNQHGTYVLDKSIKNEEDGRFSRMEICSLVRFEIAPNKPMYRF